MKFLLFLFPGLLTICSHALFEPAGDDPRASCPAELRSLSTEQVQRRLLDPHTVLLEYRLGTERSVLRVVTHDSASGYVLPPRGEIEPMVAKLSRRILDRRRVLAERAFENGVTRLGEMLLGPVAERLEGRRLLIVPDGGLHDLPFGVLPLPGEDRGYEPLVLRSELVVLPSVSMLYRLRAVRRDRARAPKALAVIADPVFDPHDARLGGVSGIASRQRAAGELSDRLARLPYSRREAGTISRFVDPDQRLRALDFDASRKLVESGVLRQYRILHFATHAAFDRERPERSGLILSRVDERGRSRDGLLRAREIPGLGLAPELVVLSACRTAAGGAPDDGRTPDVSRGFLTAGAAAVVASLWRVDDEATSELMIRFYRGLLRQRLPPAAALRRAQVSMWRDADFAAPFYWAGFILQGDWRSDPLG